MTSSIPARRYGVTTGRVASQFRMMRKRAGVNFGWRGMFVGEGKGSECFGGQSEVGC